MSISQILEEYRKSDYGTRLIFFIANRELRQQFSDIDSEGNRTAHIEERNKIMQLWTDYLDRLKKKTQTLRFTKSA